MERLLPRIRVIDAVHPLFGQPLEVGPSGLIRRIGWIRVVLPDGRHRALRNVGVQGGTESSNLPSPAASPDMTIGIVLATWENF